MRYINLRLLTLLTYLLKYFTVSALTLLDGWQDPACKKSLASNPHPRRFFFNMPMGTPLNREWSLEELFGETKANSSGQAEFHRI